MTRPPDKRGFKGGPTRRGGPKQRGNRRVVRRRPVRRGQLISPFGVGAITDFRNDEALMCAGLDAWFASVPPHECVLSEERLQQKLGCAHFVRPPEFSEDE